MSIQSWIEHQAGDNRPLRWIVGRDTGMSSKAIWAHMMGVQEGDISQFYPGDASDFGRCIRLLDLMPEWKERLPEMARYGHVWAALVSNWPILVETHANNPSGGALYELMRQIIDPAQKAQNYERCVRIGL